MRHYVLAKAGFIESYTSKILSFAGIVASIVNLEVVAFLVAA